MFDLLTATTRRQVRCAYHTFRQVAEVESHRRGKMLGDPRRIRYVVASGTRSRDERRGFATAAEHDQQGCSQHVVSTHFIPALAIRRGDRFCDPFSASWTRRFFAFSGSESRRLDMVATVETMAGFLSPSETARALGIADSTVRYLVRTGKLPAVRTPNGLILRVADVDQCRQERARKGERR